MKSVSVSFGAGCRVGGALIWEFYNYPFREKRAVGIQVSYSTIGLYRETAPIDGGKYIPLKQKLSKYFFSSVTSITKNRLKAKKLQIRILRR